ncbi:RagB/SusD family nutrient uptake outer membrane protein [Puia sp. P3]|uniref:RagB/SusD family nutrient uptake outer membrane protein n=1 Tax=Puia sp. P3 TaxID=3423952 RepID=UPI003D67CF41
MKRLIIYLLPVMLLSSSCKKYLDVKPQSQVAADQLFSTPQGFEQALDGVYTRCSQTDLYGKEMTMGLPDVLAQDWTVAPNADYVLNYLQSILYNYQDPNFISRRDAIWSGLYNAIANDNLLLQYLDSGKVVSAAEFPLIKGEALALRGYMHFDALRLFAPSYLTGANAAAIPYVTAFSNKVTPTSTVADVIRQTLKDLNDAKALLRTVDPILNASYAVSYSSDTSSETKSPNLFLQRRRTRLNYYAVCGELARVYLYMNDKTNALSNALEVINSRKFPFTSQSDFINPDPTKKDRLLYKELIFSWGAVPTLKDALTLQFGEKENSLHMTNDMGNLMYETAGVGANDLRFKQWFTPDVSLYFAKYNRDPNSNLDSLVVPALRLSEMYYIAAETTYGTDPVKAVSYVDTVRAARNVDPLQVSSSDEFMTALVKEARKEFVGEGQIFYMYKRLNRGIVGPTGIVNAPVNKVFVLPLPINEIEFGGR